MRPGLMRRIAEHWWARMDGPDRTVVLAATVARGSAVLLVASFVALAWPHLHRPGWSLAVGGILVAESAVVVAWWLRVRRPAPVTPLVDVPVSAAALLAQAALAAHPSLGGWAGFVMPYAVVVAFTIGLACRNLLSAVLCGLVLMAAGAGGDALLLHKPLLSAVAALPMLVVNPVVGAASARLLRRGTIELDAAHADSVRRLTEVTAEQERVRYAMALHDRVLQTLETLARSELLTDPGLHRRVADQAFWLRRYVELGGELRDDDLAARIASAAWQVSRETGARIEVNDAGLRGPDAPAIDAAAVTELVRQILALLGEHCDALVLRAAHADAALVVSVLGSRRETEVREGEGEVREGEVREGEVREGEVRETEGNAREGEARETVAREGEAHEGEARETEAPETKGEVRDNAGSATDARETDFHPARLDPIRQRAAEIGATLLVEPMPYVELSIRTGDGHGGRPRLPDGQ